MRSCQSLRGLPPDVADWMRRWTHRQPVAGRCFEAMRERPISVVQHRGFAVYLHHGAPNGTIHTWGTYSGRVVDPTAHQFGAVPMALYRLHALCPSCGQCPTVGEQWQKRCWCFRDPAVLPHLIDGGPVYEEPGAPDYATILARLGARRAA